MVAFATGGFTTGVEIAHASLLARYGLEIAEVAVSCVLAHALTVCAINRLVVRRVRSSTVRREGVPLDGPVAAERTRQRSKAISTVFKSLATTMIYGAGLLFAASTLQFPVVPMLVSASAVVIVVGVGAKSMITDCLAGISMIFNDRFGVGDIIRTDLAAGTVLEMGLRVTKLRDATNGQIWYVRNGLITNVRVQSEAHLISHSGQV